MVLLRTAELIFKKLVSHNLVIKTEIQVGELYCFSNYTNYLCLAK